LQQAARHAVFTSVRGVAEGVVRMGGRKKWLVTGDISLSHCVDQAQMTVPNQRMHGGLFAFLLAWKIND